jgi:hypothetical protein
MAELEGMVVDGGLEVNDDSISALREQVRQTLIAENLPKILSLAKTKWASEWQRVKDEAEGNTVQPNTKSAPTQKTGGRGIERMFEREDSPSVLG